MRALLDFLKKYNYWFLFFLLEGIGLSLLFRFNAYQQSVWFTSANAASGAVMEKWSDLMTYLSLGEQNKQLTYKNIILEQEIASLNEQLKASAKDEAYALLQQSDAMKDFQLLSAEVVDASLFKKNNFLTINKGEEDGVQPEMGVVAGTGVVGIVYATSKKYALVMPLLHEKSNVSCQLQGTHYFGYLKWTGESPDYAYLVDIPRHAKVDVGMKVETSGFSAVFPAGVQIGNVTSIDSSDDGLSYRLRVRLSTDFGCLRDVCVMQSENSREIGALQQMVKDEK